MKYLMIFVASLLTSACSTAPEPQQLSTTYRHTILVSDLERSLTLYRDALGLTVGRVNETAADSYASVFFDIPRGSMKRFAYLDGAGDRKSVFGIGEVAGVDFEIPEKPRSTAWVQPVADVEDVMEKVQALGLRLVPAEEVFIRETGQVRIETGVIDFDGHLVMFYGMKK